MRAGLVSAASGVLPDNSLPGGGSQPKWSGRVAVVPVCSFERERFMWGVVGPPVFSEPAWGLLSTVQLDPAPTTQSARPVECGKSRGRAGEGARGRARGERAKHPSSSIPIINSASWQREVRMETFF